MSDDLFKALLTLYMNSHPTLCGGEVNNKIILDTLNREATVRGCPDWLDAYHHFPFHPAR